MTPITLSELIAKTRDVSPKGRAVQLGRDEDMTLCMLALLELVNERMREAENRVAAIERRTRRF